MPLWLLLAFLIALCGASGFYFYDARQELNRLRAIEAASRSNLEETQARLADEERTLDRLRNDPHFVEKVIRSKLGYARPDEVIFRFEQ